MAKYAEINAYVDVADQAEAEAVLKAAAAGQLEGFPGVRFAGGVIEHDHPVAVSTYQLDEHGQPRIGPEGKPVLNALRDDKGKVVADRTGRPQFPAPLPAKLRVRLSYRP